MAATRLEELWKKYRAAGGSADATAFGVWLIREQPDLSEPAQSVGKAIPEPSPQQMTGILLARLQRFLHLSSKPILRTTGLGSPDEFGLLATLLFVGRCTKSQLLRQCLLELTTGSQMLKRLKEDGLIREEANPADGRSSFIQLTAKGHRVLMACFKALGAMDDPLQALDAAERRTLLALLDKLDGHHSALQAIRPMKELLRPKG